MAWGLKQHATQLTNVTTEQFFSLTPALSLGEIAVCQIETDFPADPVDYLVVDLYSTLDASSEKWDTLPFQEVVIYPDQPVASFVVRDRYKFRVGVRRGGATDTITSVDLWYRTGVTL